MRPLLAVPLVVSFGVISACAASTSASAPQSARPDMQSVTGAAAGSLVITSNTTADVTHLPNTVDAVWRILPSVFDSVGIPITTLDHTSKQIGNPSFKIRRQLGKVYLSRYLDCGNTQIGPNADSYDVLLSVVTQVTAEGPAGSKLMTTVEAQAKPVTYNQAYSRCASKGGIEIRISDLVKKRLSQ